MKRSCSSFDPNTFHQQLPCCYGYLLLYPLTCDLFQVLLDLNFKLWARSMNPFLFLSVSFFFSWHFLSVSFLSFSWSFSVTVWQVLYGLELNQDTHIFTCLFMLQSKWISFQKHAQIYKISLHVICRTPGVPLFHHPTKNIPQENGLRGWHTQYSTSYIKHMLNDHKIRQRQNEIWFYNKIYMMIKLNKKNNHSIKSSSSRSKHKPKEGYFLPFKFHEYH